LRNNAAFGNQFQITLFLLAHRNPQKKMTLTGFHPACHHVRLDQLAMAMVFLKTQDFPAGYNADAHIVDSRCSLLEYLHKFPFPKSFLPDKISASLSNALLLFHLHIKSIVWVDHLRNSLYRVH
jgi:hypothetical protein